MRGSLLARGGLAAVRKYPCSSYRYLRSFLRTNPYDVAKTATENQNSYKPFTQNWKALQGALIHGQEMSSNCAIGNNDIPLF